MISVLLVGTPLTCYSNTPDLKHWQVEWVYGRGTIEPCHDVFRVINHAFRPPHLKVMQV
jgi:hypothetical protein